MTAIKAVCFDLDGVYFTSKGKKSFQGALTIEYGADEAVALHFMTKSPEMAQLVRGQMSNADFWNHLRKATGISATDQELTDRWVRDYEVNADVQKAVLRAKELGYKTCICTNNNGIRLPVLIEKFHLLDEFDAIVSSHEVGACKPDRKIFSTLVERLRVEPAELVYSDDNLDRLQGAEQLGIKTFVYRDFGQFLQELKKLNIDLGPSELKLPQV